MLLRTGGFHTFAATGGWKYDPAFPPAIFLHGAGLDHSVWALQTRWFAYHGWGVLAPDLPGHGRSGGAPLTTIEELADWLVQFLEAAGAGSAKLIGHSLGALIALETAARDPARADSLALIGAAAPMPVSPALLAAAKAGGHAAIDMISIWGHGVRAGLGGSQAPGLWMTAAAERLLERARPGVLFAGLTACDNYRGGLDAAARISAPVTLILGEKDRMAPLKAGRGLGAAFPHARVTVIPGAGHMLMTERPEEVLQALSAT